MRRRALIASLAVVAGVVLMPSTSALAAPIRYEAESATCTGTIDTNWAGYSITGPWTTLAGTRAAPFAGANNVPFDGTAWSQDISHGEMIRNGADQTLTIDPCNLRYLYQGKDPAANDSYSLLPWRLGLLTRTNSTC